MYLFQTRKITLCKIFDSVLQREYIRREMCPYSEFFWSILSRIRTGKTPNTYTFYPVIWVRENSYSGIFYSVKSSTIRKIQKNGVVTILRCISTTKSFYDEPKSESCFIFYHLFIINK